MGLLLRSLSLRDFRSFEAADLSFGDAMTVLVGRNAVGKTNTVEALQVLTAGESFRRPSPTQLVREGAEVARASARLEGDGRVVDVSCTITPTRRAFRRNGKRCQARDLPSTLMSVLFCPDHLSLVKRGASHRRDELDGFGCQVSPGYHRILAAYLRSVEQRNRLLRDPDCDLSLLEAWDESIALGGASLLQARLRLFGRLAPVVVEVYKGVSGGERLDCSYRSTLGPEISSESRDELASLFSVRLREARETDLRRQQTTAGPHRDDVSFLVGGRDVRTFGSQGQQRSVVLALKMAEVLLAEQLLGSRPLLLLDDVMSELDAGRREKVVSFVQEGIQTVITTTNLGYFSSTLLKAAEVVRMGE